MAGWKDHVLNAAISAANKLQSPFELGDFTVQSPTGIEAFNAVRIKAKSGIPEMISVYEVSGEEFEDVIVYFDGHDPCWFSCGVGSKFEEGYVDLEWHIAQLVLNSMCVLDMVLSTPGMRERLGFSPQKEN